jgi:hypothetical protein
MKPLGHGPKLVGGVAPNRVMVGVLQAAAKCVMDVSTPIYQAALRMSVPACGMDSLPAALITLSLTS